MDVPKISSWDQIGLGDLLAAFRKAKADSFFERSTYVAEDFARYEIGLFENLQALLDRLRAGEVDAVLEEAQRHRRPSVFAKALRFEPKRERPEAPEVHAFFSDADRAFERLTADHTIEPQFRLVGDFAVQMHIVSGLWINLIGHKYDARLTGHAFGSRVRRHGRDGSMDRPKGDDYQYEAVGSFEPYFQPYRRWRDAGMAAIRRSLDAGEAVVALTLDFSAYYHSIDPSFMTHEDFLAEIDLPLSDWEKAFTTSLVEALRSWGARAAGMIAQKDPLRSGQGGGLPIGLSAVRIITNVLLYAFDEKILGSLHPVYYGRYVDDVLLVIRDTGQLRSTEDLWRHLETCAAPFFERAGTEKPGDVAVNLGDYQGGTRLRLQPSKQRVFFLKGQAGLDLLHNIRHQVTTLSSERRLMPRIEEMELSASARALAAATNAAEEPDVLRRADGLTLRRLGWALQLRSAEILARDLDRSAWTVERKRFYAFAGSHILRPDKILEHVDYLARLISLAVSLADWTQAREMYDQAIKAIATLKAAVAGETCLINGEKAYASDAVWDNFSDWMQNACREAVLKALPWNSQTGEHRPLTRDARLLLARVGVPEDEAVGRALALRESDWARRPYKDHLRWDAKEERAPVPGEDKLADILSERSEPDRFTELEHFLAATRDEEETTGVRRVNARCVLWGVDDAGSRLPYVLATRPYTPQEIALYRPAECVFGPQREALMRWGAYTHAVRGAWRPPTDDMLGGEDQAPPGGDRADKAPLANLGGKAGQRVVHLGVTSLKTTKDSWAAAAAGRPDRSAERYGRLATIVNLAIRANPRPTHLILPELSLPEAWLDTISQILLDADISLIAGLDYQHYDKGVVSSSAALVLRDQRLGFPSSLQIRQPKLQPAPGEEEDLQRSHGKTWKDWDRQRAHPVYVHEGIHFGVLVCSELQNIEHRARFQGEVDLMTILSWNPDLETFSSLVESASLDVHAYIALVNNRVYGDSRVRAPRRADYERDVCRIRGGENEQLVVVKIEPSELRAQQSRTKRWRTSRDKYKPAPEGFQISPRRRGIPS